MQKIIAYTILILNLSSITQLRAQDVPGIRDTIHSAILNETRDVRVVLPEGYKPGSGTKYDVLFVLDAEDDAHKITDIERFEQEYRFVPPMIIVHILTIYWNDRDRDFTPSHVDSLPTSGGASHFLGFLQKELIPHIKQKYDVSGDNTLYGHSFGGLFAWYTLLNAPDLFRSYIIVDPSLWWDNGYMDKIIAQKLNNQLLSGRTLYIGSRDGQGMKDMHTDIMDTLLRQYAPSGLRWKSVHYPNETHFSLFHKTAWDGLKFTYQGYINEFDLQPVAGTVIKGKPFELFYYTPEMTGSSIHYTTDGSKPTIAAPLLHRSISISSNVVKISSFLERSRYDTTVTLNFSYGKAIAAITKPRDIESGGLHFKYYDGSWDKLPDFKQLQPKMSGVAGKSFRIGYNVAKLPDPDHFALLEEGYIEIKQDGYYTFCLNSDDGSKLYIGDQLVIDYDGIHGRWATKTYMVPLQKGFYPIRLEYFQNKYDLFLELKYIPPGYQSAIMIPLEQQFHKLK